MSLDCFKAYDIRGRVPEDIDENLARCIGLAYAQEVCPGSVVVGHDIRLESPMIAQALISGLVEGGVKVIDIGLCGTEEVYFHTFNRQPQGVGGGIMVTASHNPKGFNGMKLVREGARPISGDSGLFAIRDCVAILRDSGYQKEDVCQQERVRLDLDKSAYIQHLLSYISSDRFRPLKIVANPGNGGAGVVMRLLEKCLPFEFVFIHAEPDGNFPHGVPNPLLPEMRSVTSDAVIEHGADFGVAWDGDFDRCFFFDAQGKFVEGYYIVGLLAKVMLARYPGAKIIHDPRLTWNTIDQVMLAGGQAVQSKTGHAFIKERMRYEDAVYGGEMSAHHYFRDFAYCDSGMIPWLLIADLVSNSQQTLAQLVGERISKYPCSGEINYHVKDVQYSIKSVLDYFVAAASHIDMTDGISVELGNWRFNLRSSNTESLLRLNVEAKSDATQVASGLAMIDAIINR